MKISYLFLLAFFFLTSCKQETKFEPSIPEAELKAIFKDIVIASQAIQLYAVPNQDSVRNLFMNQISKIHKIPREEIEANIEMLKANEELFLMYCDSVSVELLSQDKNFQYGQKNKKENKEVDQKEEAIKKEIISKKKGTKN